MAPPSILEIKEKKEELNDLSDDETDNFFKQEKCFNPSNVISPRAANIEKPKEFKPEPEIEDNE